MRYDSLRAFGGAQSKAETAEQDPQGIPNNRPGAKADAGKPRVGLCLISFLPALRAILGDGLNTLGVIGTASARWPRALSEIARITTEGARKYTPNGWLLVSDGANRYMDAWGRHRLEHGLGRLIDDGTGGTGCTHIGQASWNLLAALTLLTLGHHEALITGYPVSSTQELTRLAESSLDELEGVMRQLLEAEAA